MNSNPTICIDMACNDPDNGNFDGRVPQIAISDVIELTANRWGILSNRGCPKLRVAPDAISLSGRRWPIDRQIVWHGNWCWDGFAVTLDTAVDFLVWLHGRHLYHCESGLCDLCDAWDAPGPLNPAIVREALAS